MRIDLVEDLESVVRLLNDGGWDADVRVVQEAISALESMRWIPVSERLPEPHQEVMVWPVTSDYGVTASITTDRHDKTLKWRCMDSLDACRLWLKECEPTHWMPLPAPPKVEQGEV